MNSRASASTQNVSRPENSSDGRSAETSQASEGRRISVAISPDTVKALEQVIENEQVTLTEALRRLISYGDFVYTTVKVNGEEMLLKKGDSTRAVVLLR